MKALSGKIAIVTGASRGVGKGVALGLAAHGATVYITGRTETDELLPDFMKFDLRFILLTLTKLSSHMTHYNLRSEIHT